MRHGVLCSGITSLAFFRDGLQPTGKFHKEIYNYNMKILKIHIKIYIYMHIYHQLSLHKEYLNNVTSILCVIRTKRFIDVAYFVSCKMQFTKSTLMLFGTTSTTPFLMFPVSLNTASSLDKKVSLSPVKVQPEEQDLWLHELTGI